MFYDVAELELDKILNSLQDEAILNDSKEEILLLEPTNNLKEIERELDEVEEALNAYNELKELPLDGLRSLRYALKKSNAGSILSVEEIYNVGILLRISKSLAKYAKELENLNVNIERLNEYFTALYQNKRLEDEIFNVVNDDLNIDDNATMNLFKIRRKIQMEENHLRSLMNSFLLSKSNLLTDSIIVLRDSRMCLPVKESAKNSIKGIIHDESQSGTTIFIEPVEASEIYLKIDNLRREEKVEIDNILKALSLSISSHYDELLNSYENITRLDIIYAKAKFAKKRNYTKPKLNNNNYIKLNKAAHPLIDENKVVRNDIEIGNKFKTIIITGPNTGGKTVVLKLVGIITLLAQIGMFIPAEKNSEVAVFDNVLSSIGDSQSIEQSLSTFSSHISKVKRIIDNVNDKSLVLLDEIGSGTDPKEGSSLAIAIIKYLEKNGAITIATTHYSDLKMFAYNDSLCVNASVEFNPDTLDPTYKLLIGVPGTSNALHVGANLGLKKEILDEAYALIHNQDKDYSHLLNKLDDENQRISKIKNEVEEEKKKYQKMLEELTKEKNKLASEKDFLILKARAEANEIVKDAKEKSKELLDEIKNLKKVDTSSDKDLADVKFKAKNIKIKDEKIDVRELKVSDLVRIKDYDSVGQIVKIDKNKYIVKLGQFEMSFKRDDLIFEAESKIQVEKPKTKPTQTLATKEVKMKLDLRGFRYEEVAPALDLFLDQAYLAHYKNVYIIHGYGTGAVREAVYAFLKKSKYVKSTRFGGEGEGLNGCTVVELK